MKIMYISIIFLCLISMQLFGQVKTSDSLKISEIDRNVEKIVKDPTIQKVEINRLDVDYRKNLPSGLVIFYKDHQIIQIETNPLSYKLTGDTNISYFLQNGVLYLARVEGIDSSRPGSCGFIRFVHRFYFEDEKLLTGIFREDYNPCQPNILLHHSDSNTLQLNFKKIYELIKDIKPNR